jgi:hypothetical protein
VGIVEYAQRRYGAVLEEVERLKQSEFPYSHSQKALLELENVFKLQLDALKKLTPQTTPQVAKVACSQSMYSLYLCTPVLGFILRSTNARNAFELYSPLLRLSRQILGIETSLLLSSEWDYSPFVLMPTSFLPTFVLIGLPAHESANPLLVTLAGHELGHNVWQQQTLSSTYDSQIRTEVIRALENQLWPSYHALYPQFTKGELETNIFARETWVPAHSWATRQLEEVFCDVMGVRIFAEAFLHAFAYLLSPGAAGERAPYYPNIAVRVKYLERAALSLAVNVPTGFVDDFDSDNEPTEPFQKLLVSAADAATASLVDEISTKATSFADSKSLPTRSHEKVRMIADDFKMVVPAAGPATMTDIINAGWLCYHDHALWNNVAKIGQKDHSRVLHDLILKSFEVTEVYERVHGP